MFSKKNIMPRTEEQNTEIREERKAEIMKVALELFANEGFHTTSISKIAKKAGISKGLLYNYFESKEQLLIEILEDAAEKGWKNFDPNRDGELTEEEFIFFINESIDMSKNNINYWKLMSSLAFQSNVLNFNTNKINQISAYYGKLMYDFLLKHNCIDPEGEMLIFAAMMKGAILQFVSAPEYYPIETFRTKIIEYYKSKLNI
jgi:AcrR family transcriptional regulator